MKLSMEVLCPYCQLVNNLVFSETDWRTPQIVSCNPERGGCGEHFSAELLVKRSPAEKCPMCGKLNASTHHRSKFCPPLDWKREHRKTPRSDCEQRYQQMVFFSRKDYREGKFTVEELASKFGRPISEIQSWIEGRKER